jgi:membrane-bound lytic murein transglycosylase B
MAGPSASPVPLPTLQRPQAALAGWAASVSSLTDIPLIAAEAYGYAQLAVDRAQPNCHLGWTTLAAIGKIETNHGQAGGARLLPNGRTDPLQLGPVLDGQNGQPLVPDTDAGAYDGNTQFDRALGPLHLLPSMWVRYGTDGNLDGIADPFNIDDEAVALGLMLCANQGDLSKLADWQAAIGTYHAGAAYASSVFSVADSYGQRTQSAG